MSLGRTPGRTAARSGIKLKLNEQFFYIMRAKGLSCIGPDEEARASGWTSEALGSGLLLIRWDKVQALGSRGSLDFDLEDTAAWYRGVSRTV